MAHLGHFRKEVWVQLPDKGHLELFQVLWIFYLMSLALQKGLNLLQYLSVLCGYLSLWYLRWQ